MLKIAEEKEVKATVSTRNGFHGISIGSHVACRTTAIIWLPATVCGRVTPEPSRSTVRSKLPGRGDPDHHNGERPERRTLQVLSEQSGPTLSLTGSR